MFRDRRLGRAHEGNADGLVRVPRLGHSLFLGGRHRCFVALENAVSIFSQQGELYAKRNQPLLQTVKHRLRDRRRPTAWHSQVPGGARCVVEDHRTNAKRV
jgi:hypothetical protein